MSNTPHLERVAIDLGDRSYSILIGEKLLDAASTWVDLPKASAALIVTNDTVGPIYAERLQAALAPLYKQVHTVALPDGESHKDWQTLNLIFDELLGKGADRKPCCSLWAVVSWAT